MPIHLYWGDDEASRNRAVESLIAAVVDPGWQSINLTRLDGQDPAQAAQALSEARTPPLGGGDRVVLLQRSPFCSGCPAELAAVLEESLGLIPDHSHLVLISPGKPDARLRTTKALKAVALEQSFALPAVWDGSGQVELVRRTAEALGHTVAPEALEALAEAIGSDSARLASELEKLALYCGQRPIDPAAVAALVECHATNSLQVGDALLGGDLGKAISLLDALIAAGEPSLRIVAALTSQIRGWLWVSLLDGQGEQDVTVIAKAAGIGNPKRIYVMRKQIRGRPAGRFLLLLGQLLEVEAALKRGAEPGDAFRDGFLAASPR
ncbi:DNA polymerase III subunit delta [Synechococcus sp. CS-1324]|uniref:DNA polymerase III subunit delta n=1 Tax=unclassified Synechococcus TaxID=2626047 RepID=UPI000DB55239|nr:MULTISPECIES: DNA polymerase III subunit delta [unclassified Synechococcus]MCT0214711.1 DNA polymerase III subunit delta [Synechococcus sp. CS-1326]MCT0231099.1 DNA polymerase III subunit delta [Synechococcus sp. CS-1324]MCT0234045.1 DNA polymerase III subunit delta [Synechococcus sp. CS-1327]PZV05460.1 MAG: DNA polymerase III subunit delta [Cyanobium sp.]